MSNYAISLKRTGILLAALTFTALLMVVNFAAFFGKASAAQLSSRSLTLTSSLAGDVANGDANSETNGADTTHSFAFTVPSTTAAQSVLFQYCTTAIGACTAPTGLNVDAATLGAVTVFDGDWSIDATLTTASDIVILSTDTQNLSGAATIEFENITNPTAVGTFFVRIYTGSDNTPDVTYPVNDAVIDDGTVASAITEGIEITARVAETLGFSTTGSFAGVGSETAVTACDPLTGSGAIGLGDPVETTLDTGTEYANYSAFRVYTNASSGVDINYEGETLTRGADWNTDPTITAMGAIGAPVAGAAGGEQFGLAVNLAAGGDNALAANSVTGGTVDATNVDVAADLAGDPGEIAIAADYDDGGAVTPLYLFTPSEDGVNGPQLIASSAGYVECNTAAVKYIANISPITEAGTYTTTVVYSAVPTY